MPKNLLTVAATGAKLEVSRSTVWRLIQSGRLPSVRLHGRRLIPASAVKAQARARIRRDMDALPPLTFDHPIFRMIGIGNSGGGMPDSSDKYGILAMAERERNAPPPAHKARRMSGE